MMSRILHDKRHKQFLWYILLVLLLLSSVHCAYWYRQWQAWKAVNNRICSYKTAMEWKDREDIIRKCREYGLRTPEFYQEEDFRVVIWRTAEFRSDPKAIQSDPKAIQSDPNKVEALIRLVKVNPSISRAELAKQLGLSERQVRKIIDCLRAEGRLVRRGGTTGEWLIIKN